MKTPRVLAPVLLLLLVTPYLAAAENGAESGDLIYSAGNGSVHYGRATVVEFEPGHTMIHDYLNVYNPSDEEFSGSVTIEVPEGARVNSVADFNGSQLNYEPVDGRVDVDLSIGPGESKPVALHLCSSETTVSLTADRYTREVYLVANTSVEGTSRGNFGFTGPVEVQGTTETGDGYISRSGTLNAGAEYGVFFDPPSGPGSTEGGGGEILLGSAIAVALVSALLFFGRYDGRLGDMLNLGGTPDRRGEKCPDCGASSEGDYCPLCGTSLGHFCPECGSEMGTRAAFCGDCGAEL